MSYKILRNNIETLLNEVSEVKEVNPRPTFKFAKFPATFIARSGNEADYQSSQDNIRVYAFKVWAFAQYDDQTTYDQADDDLMDAADAILDKMDEQENPGSAREMADNLGAGKTLVGIGASPSLSASDDNDQLLGIEITVRCKVLVDLTVLS